MRGIDSAIRIDDQPIGRSAATLMGEARYLTSWINPHDLEVEERFRQLTRRSASPADSIVRCWQHVRDIPYVEFVKTTARIGKRQYVQPDTWLDAGQALRAPALNCMNKSIVLASLLRQMLPPDQVFVCLNNVTLDGVGGHAICYLNWNSQAYAVEATVKELTSPFVPVATADMYESVIFFNDEGVWRVPGPDLEEPFGFCCQKWLSDYINKKLCTRWE